MNDLVPIPLDLFDRLRRAGLDVYAILRRAKLLVKNDGEWLFAERLLYVDWKVSA